MKAIRQIVRYLRPERSRRIRRRIVNAKAVEPEPERPDGMAAAVRRQRERRQRWLKEGEPSVARFVGQIGVLGWIIVTPTLIGLFIGRWLDHKFGNRYFLERALVAARRGDRILVGLAMDAQAMTIFDLLAHDPIPRLLGAGAWFAVGALVGAFHFLTLRWNVHLLVIDRRALSGAAGSTGAVRCPCRRARHGCRPISARWR